MHSNYMLFVPAHMCTHATACMHMCKNTTTQPHNTNLT